MTKDIRANAGSKSQPNGDRFRFGGVGFIAGVTFGAVLTLCVAAYAASINISGGAIGTSTATNNACANSGITFATVRTRYVPGSPGRYEFASVGVNSVPAGCQSKPNRITVVNSASPFNALNNGNAAPNDGALLGSFGGASNTATWTSGQGPLLNNVDNSDSRVKFVLAIRS